MSYRLRLAVILGSVREGRLCDTVADWVLSRVRAHGAFDPEVIDPKGDWPAIDTGRFRRSLELADAVLVITPEYNHSYPGPLKMLIDSAKEEWSAKPVAFVSYGGISGGLRAVEHLRAVFAELRAVGLRDSVSFANAWDLFGPDGTPREEARFAASMDDMLSRLQWWATLLGKARDPNSLGEAA